MRRVLIVTNGYPSAAMPFSCIFVRNQYERLRQDLAPEFAFELFGLDRANTGLAGSAAKYLAAGLRFLPLLFRRYDLVHLHFFFPFIWLCVVYKALHPATRIVVTLHGSDVVGRFRPPLSRALHSFAARRVDHVISVGEALGAEFTTQLGRRVDEILPAGIDEEVFQPQAGTAARYDLVFVGHFIERKGIDLYVEALARMPPGLSLCFIGAGALEPLIRSLQPRHRVTVLQDLPQTDIARTLPTCRFLVLPSRIEAFGLVVTEAMYCGVPVIASTASGPRMQVEHGINGFITANDPDSLAACITRALAMPAGDYARMAAAAVTSNRQFALSTVCRRLADIYRALLRN